MAANETEKREARHTFRLPDDVKDWLEIEKKRLGINKNVLVIAALRLVSTMDRTWANDLHNKKAGYQQGGLNHDGLPEHV